MNNAQEFKKKYCSDWSINTKNNINNGVYTDLVEQIPTPKTNNSILISVSTNMNWFYISY